MENDLKRNFLKFIKYMLYVWMYMYTCFSDVIQASLMAQW